ncbi:hypothetical protein ACLOJK_031833 [Asimina triloba]
MKAPDPKMPRMEDILNLPVQEPPRAEFSAAHINWVKIDGGRQGGDDIALIPFCRVDDFVKGESTNAECPASFRVESRRKRSEGSISKPRVDGYLEYTLYWCSYGPEDYRDCEAGMGDGPSNKPTSGKGSRPGRRHMMRGCLCHFTVKRLYTRPLLALIIYNQRNHVDKTGAPCHGLLDRDAVGTRAMYAPRISEELRQRVMSMLYVGISLDNIIEHHLEGVQKHGGPCNRDDLLTRNDVRNMERVIRNSTYELHENEVQSIQMWVQRHQKHVVIFQDASTTESFTLCIQTEWQLQQMLRYGHDSSVAFHSASGLNKLRVREPFVLFSLFFPLDRWLSRIELWVAAVRTVPIAFLEFNASIESYHLRLKSRLYGTSCESSWARIDWLVHALTTEFHSLYWFDQYIEESGSFRNLRDESLTNSCYRALHILDVDVMLDVADLRLARVISQSDRSVGYTIWNPGSEFSLCDCAWSRSGNLCKHVIKVGILCRNRHFVKPSLAAQTYRQTLLSLLQNPPDDPIVLDHAILLANRMQQDLKGLEELSSNGLLLSVNPSDMIQHVGDNPLPQARLSVDGVAKIKRPRTSNPGVNAVGPQFGITEHISPALHSEALMSNQTREVIGLLKMHQGSNQHNIINEQSILNDNGIGHGIV